MKVNQTSYLVLGLLSIQPGSGYDIRKAVESSVSYFWRESYGQIYPTLKRLADDGLIVPRRSASPGRRQRQEYSLSAKGRACLREWLAAPYSEDPPRNEFLLKLFFGRSASPGICVAHIEAFRDRNKNLLAALIELEKQAYAHNAGNPHLPFWMLTLGYGIGQVRASVEWSESVLAHFEKTKTAPTARTHAK